MVRVQTNTASFSKNELDLRLSKLGEMKVDSETRKSVNSRIFFRINSGRVICVPATRILVSKNVEICGDIYNLLFAVGIRKQQWGERRYQSDTIDSIQFTSTIWNPFREVSVVIPMYW